MSRLPRQTEALARMLTYMLGHRPDEFGLVLSEDGSVPLKHLLQALSAEPGFAYVRRRHLEEATALATACRLEIQGDRIRSLHPSPANLRHPLAAPPPALLYLAIPQRAHARVWQEGLKAPAGQELVLTSTPEVALKLGRRRGAEVLVTVRAQAAARAGVALDAYGDTLHLAAAVPREFLQLPAPPPEAEKPRPPARPQAVPGALVLDLPQILQGASPKPRKLKGEAAWKTGARALRKKRRREE